MKRDKYNNVSEYFECSCKYPEHLLRVSFDSDPHLDEEPFFEICIFLSTYCGFFRRVWLGLKYIFNCGQPNWDTIIFEPEDVDNLEKVCVEYKKVRDNWLKKKRFQ